MAECCYQLKQYGCAFMTSIAAALLWKMHISQFRFFSVLLPANHSFFVFTDLIPGSEVGESSFLIQNGVGTAPILHE
jgi:hypothetical protein